LRKTEMKIEQGGSQQRNTPAKEAGCKTQSAGSARDQHQETQSSKCQGLSR
jgi:hypothetical protein